MSWSDLMSGASDVVLSTFGVSGTYHSMTHGAVETEIIIDRDVEIEDESGVFSRRARASLVSGVLSPRSGDWIEVAGERWSVEAPDSDDGHIQSVWVRPDL